MFSLALIIATLAAPQLVADAQTQVQPLVRYHVLAPDQTTAQQVARFLSTPGSLTPDLSPPARGTLALNASYHGAVTVAGLSYYSEPARPGQPWATPQQKYQNHYVVQPVSGVPNEIELLVAKCADALNRKETNQWQLTDLAVKRWTSTAPGIMDSWTTFARSQIPRAKAEGWTFLGEGHSYNPAAQYSATSWKFTRSSPGTVRSLYVSLTNAGPVRLTYTEYAFAHI
jgi:hypothetical protein